MSTPSPALLHKIAKARANAPADVPLVRACARVVLASGSSGGLCAEALRDLKTEHGANWSFTTALQLLSGRRGEFAAECAPPAERVALYMAHLIAKSVCTETGLGAVAAPSQADLDTFRILAERHLNGMV